MDRYLNRDTLLILAGNALPLVGTLVAGWDAFVLIVFYWCETAVIGFWVCVRLALGDGSAGGRILPGAGLAAFIAAHAGIFMAVHMVFILTLFGGAWMPRIDGPAAFVAEVIVGTGLWLPLAGLFLLRGLMMVADLRAGAAGGSPLGAFYVRIFVMQGTVLLGGFVALAVGGSLAGLILLVALKTVADLASGPLIAAAEQAQARTRAERNRAR